MLPFSLEHGLLLEDRQVLLPWGLAWRMLTALGSPEVNMSDLVCWQNVTCLGGIRANVVGRPNPERPLRDLEVTAASTGESPEQTFSRVGTHFRELIGAPTTSADAPLPHEEWKMPPITIFHGIFDRFGEYHVIRIRHRGTIETVA